MRNSVSLNKKYVLSFIKSCKIHLNNMDKIMTFSESHERGKAIAKELNRFNFDYDVFLHFACDVPLDKLQSVLNKTFKLKIKENRRCVI